MRRPAGLAFPRSDGRRSDPGTRRDPFAVLGLDAVPGLTDDDVRAAWRRIAAATHPDRADGGDPGRYAAAAAAFTELRTRFGRGEALAGLTRAGDARAGPAAGTVQAGTGAAAGVRSLLRWPAGLPGRVARGRPLRLALRTAAAAAVTWGALAARASHGAGPALAVGVLTWLILTGRQDLAP